MKTLKELQEDINAVGKMSDIIPAGALRPIKEFARQISNALQSGPKATIQKIEEELNKYGYSLGEVDYDQEFADVGSEDFALICVADGEVVRNVFLTLTWKEVGPEIYAYSPEVLSYKARLMVRVIDPADFETAMSGGEVEVQDDDAINADQVYGDDDRDLALESAQENFLIGLTESAGKFTADQLNKLRNQYKSLPDKLDPSSAPFKRLEKFVHSLDKSKVNQLANAKIKWLSQIAKSSQMKSHMSLKKTDRIKAKVREDATSDLSEEQIDHERGTVTMTKKEYQRQHKDYKGTRNGKPTLLRMGPKGTTPYTVIFKEETKTLAELEESFRTKTVGRTMTAFAKGNVAIDFTVTKTGIELRVGDAESDKTVRINKAESSRLMDALIAHYKDNT